MPDSNMPAAPYALAMLVCDGLHLDPMTGKTYVMGCFSKVFAREFPATQAMCVYAILTDGYGKVPVIVRIVDVDAADEPLFEAKAEVEFTDPRMMVELTFGPEGVTFPAPGEYRIQLFAGPEFVIERRIVLQHVGGEPENG
jgi:hypothetical protein